MNKKTIVTKLKAAGIAHDPKAKAADLEKLLPPEAAQPQPPVPQNDPNVPVSQRKAAFKAVIEAYKAQNPAKYELKKEHLQKQLDAIQ